MSGKTTIIPLILSLWLVISLANAFSPGHAIRRPIHRHHVSSFFGVSNHKPLWSSGPATARHLLPPDWSSGIVSSIMVDPHIITSTNHASVSTIADHWSTLMLLSLDVFDGSTIIDPVVVSDTFWNGLQRQLLSLVIGQFLAGVVFTLLVTIFASQLSNVRDFIGTTLSSSLSSTDSDRKRDFIKADATSQPRVPPDYGTLLVCLLIDIVGSSSELIPILGELTDLISAPISATILQRLFGGGRILFVLELVEEILPFTDIIPFATICWVIDTYYPESDIAGVLQLGVFRADNNNRNGRRRNDDDDDDDTVIDTTAKSDTQSSSR